MVELEDLIKLFCLELLFVKLWKSKLLLYPIPLLKFGLLILAVK